MNLQTERMENHKARLTVEIEPALFESAKRKAARKISRQVTIRGFRKGKAPYSRVAQTVGEATIIEEAVDDLTQDIYRQALENSKVEPYGPGDLEDVKLDPPTFIYTLPMKPVVDLNSYQDVRVDYEAPTIDESDVDARLRQYQLQFMKVLDDEVETAQLGHRVTIDVDSAFLDGEEPEDEDSAVDEDAEPADTDEAAVAPAAPKKGEVFVSEKDTPVILDPNEDPFMDGFVENLLDSQQGDDVVFELTIPDDDADPTIAGRLVEFVVTIKRIEAIDIPELDDDFLIEVNKIRPEDASSLATLREALREELDREARQRSENEYAEQVMTKIVEGADIHYPEVALEYQINRQLSEFKGRIEQQGLSFDDFMRFTGNNEAELRERFRDEAMTRVEHSLAMSKLREELGTDVEDEDIEVRLEAFAAPFASENTDNDQNQVMRNYIRDQVDMSHLSAKLVALGRGEDMSAAVEAKRAEAAADLQRALQERERNRASLDAEQADAEDLESGAAAGAVEASES
ncbi:MAG: trigger factor [Chloroflexi bacterium]|nr:trigger factor [Chloroflexota bacterium]